VNKNVSLVNEWGQYKDLGREIRTGKVLCVTFKAILEIMLNISVTRYSLQFSILCRSQQVFITLNK